MGSNHPIYSCHGFRGSINIAFDAFCQEVPTTREHEVAKAMMKCRLSCIIVACLLCMGL